MSLPILTGVLTGRGAFVGGVVVGGLGAFIALRGLRVNLHSSVS